jgi:hypothetical protein
MLQNSRLVLSVSRKCKCSGGKARAPTGTMTVNGSSFLILIFDVPVGLSPNFGK